VVQVAAFASAEKVKEVVDLLKEAKIPHYTESIATANGPVTRVRIGPFGSKDAADKARERVSTLGRAKGLALNPSNPVAK
jgi:DedD protein